MINKLTIVTKRLDNPYIVAYDRILRKYGHGCYPSQPIDDNDTWKININANIPKVIKDDKTLREKQITYIFKNIGELLISKNTNKIISQPTIKEFSNNIFNKRVQIRNSVEQDLVKVIGDPELKIKFGKMKFAFLGMQPIYRTIINLLNGEYPSKIELKKINYSELVQLIVDLNYAEYNNDFLTPTNKLYELSKRYNYSDVETSESFLGIMLANYYDYLYQTLRIIHFVPYVRIGTSYYANSIQYGDMLRMSINSLTDNIKMYYRKSDSYMTKRQYGINTLVTELAESGVLKFEDDKYITGRTKIFDSLINIRNTIPMEESSNNYL